MLPEADVMMLLSVSDVDSWQAFLKTHPDVPNDQILNALEQYADRLRLESPKQALHAAEALLRIAAFLDDDRVRANGLRIKGNLLLYQGHYQQSITCYQTARAIRQHNSENLEIARLQVGWTVALIYLTRYDEALNMGLQTRDILLAHEKWVWLANLELNIGSVYRQTAQYETALDMYTQSQSHFLQADNAVGMAQAQVNAARVWIDRDNFHEARDLLQQARFVFEEHTAWVPFARAEMNLAIVSYRTGEYREALERYEQAWTRFKALDNEMEMAAIDLHRARVYIRLNLYPEALELAQRAHLVFEDLEMARFAALANLYQAQAYRGLNKVDRALEHFQCARDHFAGAATDPQHDTLTARVDLEQAALLRKMGRSSEAVKLVKTVLKTFTHHALSVRQAQAQLLLAECYCDLEQNAQATTLYQTVLELPSERRLPTLSYRAHYGLGQVLEAQGQQKMAYQHYQDALVDIALLRHSLRVDEFKASFLDDKLSIYQAAVRLGLALGYVEQAFGYVERAKSSALLDLLALNLDLRAEEGEPVDPQLWERLRSLKQTWLWHYSKLEDPPDADDETTSRSAERDMSLWEDLKRVEMQMREVWRQMQEHRIGVGEHPQDKDENPAWHHVRQYMKEDGHTTVLVEYFCIGDEILAFLLDVNGKIVVCRDFPYSLREVQRSLGALNLSLKNVRSLDPQYVRDVLHPLALRHLSWLYQALIAPLWTYIERCDKLFIVPHDVLYYLPFHAFYDGEHYLLERFEIQYAPSAGVLARCYQVQHRQLASAPSDVAQRSALVMSHSDGGRLHYVSDEAQAVATTLPGAQLVQEDAATLGQFRQLVGESYVIHLASHATFRSDNALFSSIKLADTPLNVIDLYHMRLNASLVTLSACETGMSQLKGGDLFGLVRGCLYAGTPALIASLWQVDDASTALLMTIFYEQLSSGVSIASALRTAQLALLHSDDEKYPAYYAHPHYWAPFFLTGADNVFDLFPNSPR